MQSDTHCWYFDMFCKLLIAAVMIVLWVWNWRSLHGSPMLHPARNSLQFV